MHNKRRSSGGVDVIERRLCWTVAARVARIEQVLAVRGAAGVAAVLGVVATTSVSV